MEFNQAFRVAKVHLCHYNQLVTSTIYKITQEQVNQALV